MAAASARVCVLAGEVLEDERAKWDLAGRVDPAPAELAPVTTHKERVAQRRREWKLKRTRAHARDAQHKHTHAESATCYGRRYPDLAYAFCKDECNVQALHRHFQSHGRREGRRFGCEAAPLTAAETAKWKVHEARLRAKDPTPTVCNTLAPHSRTAGAQKLAYLQRCLRLEARVERTDTSVRRLPYFRTTLGISGGKYHATGNRRRNSRAPTIDSSSPTSWTSRGR